MIKLSFSLEMLGWMDCRVTAEDSIVELSHSSDYGDKFQELVNAILIFEEFYLDPKINEYRIAVEWFNDINVMEWEFAFGDENCLLRINEKNQNQTTNLLSTTFELGTLLDEVFENLNCLYRKFGLRGFKDSWEAGNFPIAEYLLLKQRRSNQTTYERSEGLSSSSINEEIELLSDQTLDSHSR